MLVSAIIPAFDEEKTIAKTVSALQAVDEIDEIIVIDDGSRDRTADESKEAGAITFSLAENCGKGQALQVGCAISQGEILLLLDADLQDTAQEAIALLRPVMRGEADMSIAVIPLSAGKGGFGLAQRLSRWAVQRSGGPKMAQPLSGQRAFRRQIWRELGFSGGFGVETALSMGVHRRGYRMVEVPVLMSHRRTTKDWKGVVHRGRQFLHVFLAIVRHWRWLI
ncbi:MAG: glycosyltransferase family 2 protein [Firmicutes bacterium]|mgnify:CR=1 FL=1|nr:glycosyltransferase family 2 protein [Bacillota bacterium]